MDDQSLQSGVGKAASSHLMLDVHEPVRPTGLHRSYPNLMACEAARGNEFNAWSLEIHRIMKPYCHLQDCWEDLWITHPVFLKLK